MSSIAIPANEEVSKLRPALVMVLAITAGTFAAIMMRLAQGAGLPSPVIASGRMVLSALILTPLVIQKYRPELQMLSRRDLVLALIAGFWLQVHFMAIVYSLERTSIMVFIVIINTGPLWTAILERTFLKARLTRTVWFGLFITIAGGMLIALMTGSSDANTTSSVLGILLALIASVTGSAYLTIGRSVRAKVSLFPYVWIVYGFGGLAGITTVLISGTPITGHPPMGYFWVVMIALIPQLIGHTGFNYAVAFFSATVISIIGQSITITTSIAAYIIFGEIPGKYDLIGGAIIMLGVLLAIVGRNQRSAS